MTKKAMKYGLMTITAVLLVALAFAGAASAITADEWNSMTTSAQINGNETYVFTGNGIIYPKFNGTSTTVYSTETTYVPNRSITFDFTNYQGTFAGVSSAPTANQSALFGSIENTTYSGTITIKNLRLTNVNVTPILSSNNFGGIVGYFKGKSMDESILNFTNCSLENCSIGSATSGKCMGGLLGYANSATVNVVDCRALHCDVMAFSMAGGLVGCVEYDVNNDKDKTRSTMMRCSVFNSTLTSFQSSTWGGSNVGGLVGWAGFASFDSCCVENTSVSGPTFQLGGLVGCVKYADEIKDCYVTNCVFWTYGGGYVAGLCGCASFRCKIENSCVKNCAINGAWSIGGLVGGVRDDVDCTGCSNNSLLNSAVSATFSPGNIDCGDKPGIVGCIDTTGSYLYNGTAGQPVITVYPHTRVSQPAPNYFGVINVTKLTNIGLLNDSKTAAGYVVITEEPLVFNPCNDSSITYDGNVQLGDTTITFATPVRPGYLFSGWNLTSTSGTMLTDNAGTLQTNVAGYTNASSQWNNASGVAVTLFANWTAAPAKEFEKIGDEITLDSGYAISKINVSGTGINNISFAYDQNVSAPTRSGYHDQKAFGDAFNITVTNGSINGGTAKIYFNISKADLGTCNPANIMLAHFKNNAWEYLKTVKESEDSVNVQFSAETTSFSPFYRMYMVQDAQQYTPSSSSKQTGSTIILSEGQAAPTAYATAAPTVKPTEQLATPTVIATAKPTTQATQQSPVPVFGIIAGLGAAAVLLRLRK